VIDSEALDYAFSRVEGFTLVQQSATLEERGEAIESLLTAFGINENLKAHFARWMDDFYGDTSGEIFLGLILGLYAAEYALEND